MPLLGVTSFAKKEKHLIVALDQIKIITVCSLARDWTSSVYPAMSCAAPIPRAKVEVYRRGKHF